MFNTRSLQDEWMDLPTTKESEFIQALQDIQWVNANLRGTELIKNALFSQVTNDSDKYKILDIATGSADIPLALAQQARQTGHRFEITAIDIHPLAVEVGKTVTAGYPEIQVLQANAFNLAYKDQSFDWVISSMFMHHLSNEDAVFFLREMVRLAKYGIIINDLERHPLAYWGIHCLGQLMRKGRIFRNDAPLSVLRGFRHKELKALCAQSQLSSMQISHHSPFRWLLIWNRDNDSRLL